MIAYRSNAFAYAQAGGAVPTGGFSEERRDGGADLLHERGQLLQDAHEHVLTGQDLRRQHALQRRLHAEVCKRTST